MSAAGLVPVLRLAEAAALPAALAGSTVPSPNAVTKTMCVVAGMLTGADSIDDLDVLRNGWDAPDVHRRMRPSSLGTHLRAFTHGHVQQLPPPPRGTLSGLAAHVPGLLAGGGPGGIAYLDIDDTVRQVHGYAEQGAAFGYCGVRVLSAQLAPSAP